MKKKLQILSLVLIVFFTFTSTRLSAQKWTGKGDGTSWNDAANWDKNEIPAAGAIVKINKAYTITGTMTNVPATIKVLKNSNIVFDLDMNVGDGVATQHCISIGAGSNVTLGVEGHNRVFNFKTPKHALAVFGGSDDVNITIAKSSTMNVDKAGFGVNLSNITSSVTNNGIINLGAEVTLGIKVGGNFTNNGKILGGSLKNKGLVLTGSFINNGEFSYTAPNDTSKLFFVDTLGTFQNNNKLFIQGGKDTIAVLVNGNLTNSKDAYFTVNSAGMKINPSGSFVNSGLLSRDGGLFITNGTSTNNGFYSYTSGGAFSEGSGVIVDNGLPNGALVDAASNCTVDLAEEAYAWYYDGDSLGVATEEGSFTFPAKSVPNDSVALTTSLTGVRITVRNICDDAVDGGGCGEIASPESLGDLAICQGETTPALKVKEATGYVADWYDAATGGTLLYTGLEYTPADVHLGDNVYYVQNREESTGCTSDRTVVKLTVNSIPLLTADSTECSEDNKTYTVYLSTGTDYNIVASAGTVDGSIVKDIPVGTDIDITATDTSTGCTSSVSVSSPKCTTATDDFDATSQLTVYPTLVKDGFLTVELKNKKDFTLSIISATGKSIKKFKLSGNSILNVSSLNPGMYFIKTNKNTKITKFIILK